MSSAPSVKNTIAFLCTMFLFVCYKKKKGKKKVYEPYINSERERGLSEKITSFMQTLTLVCVFLSHFAIMAWRCSGIYVKQVL